MRAYAAVRTVHGVGPVGLALGGAEPKPRPLRIRFSIGRRLHDQ